MAWTIRFDRSAERELSKLDRDVVERILRFINDRLRVLDNPRPIGEALKGSDLWRYHVGDYRIITRIDDKTIQILVVRIGNRRDVYRWRSQRQLNAEIERKPIEQIGVLDPTAGRKQHVIGLAQIPGAAQIKGGQGRPVCSRRTLSVDLAADL